MKLQQCSLKGDMFCLSLQPGYQSVTWLVDPWQQTNKTHPLLKHSHMPWSIPDTMLVFRLSVETSLSVSFV